MKRVLGVDDDWHTVYLIKNNLEKMGVEVRTAYDGVEALEQLALEDFDLMVLDVMMPRKDGFEVLKEIRTNPETENLRVIMLTAKAQDKDVFEGYHYGADMYLTKPFNPKEITGLFGLDW
jgi:two-component system alkaline phosphatase synthesis response regulator PhoP